MQDFKKKPAFRCLVIIVDSSIRDKVTEFLSDSSLPIYYQTHGIGTANSEFLNLCGLGDIQKAIMLCLVPKDRMRMILAELNQALQLHKKGTGIAVSIPLTGIQGWLYKLLVPQEEHSEEIEKEVKKMNETMTHAMILMTVNQGYSAEVMDTARAAGATGGTILKGLKQSPKETANLFGVAIQEEQEIIAIVVSQEKKAAIMSALSDKHGLNSPAHGITFSLPVDAIMGLS